MIFYLSDNENKNGSKIKSENNKTTVNNKKIKNTILADRAKHLQVLREQSLQREQVFVN